jgi:hypothetical protein
MPFCKNAPPNQFRLGVSLRCVGHRFSFAFRFTYADANGVANLRWERLVCVCVIVRVCMCVCVRGGGRVVWCECVETFSRT